MLILVFVVFWGCILNSFQLNLGEDSENYTVFGDNLDIASEMLENFIADARDAQQKQYSR